MVRGKLYSVVFSLAAYLLATTAIHLLHDHSHHGELPQEAAQPFAGHSCSHDGEHAGCDGSTTHDEHTPCPAGDCEGSCFACRFLAVKAIAATVVAVAEHVEPVRPVEAPQPVFVAIARPGLPLSRAPPSA